jgi:aminodeoxyfutalosine deaminase
MPAKCPDYFPGTDIFLDFYSMGLRKLKADRLFDGYRFQDHDTVLLVQDDGTIEGMVPAAEAGEGIEEWKGILSPGLINAHCHLELCHLKNVIPPHTGLIDFLCSVVTKRGFPADFIQAEIEKGEKEMWANGIVAVGDIGNTADTLAVKAKSGIRWQNFVEVLGFTDEKADENIRHYQSVADTLRDALAGLALPHRTSLVPHAPYSISPRTFEQINQLTAGQIISIHNQEHPAEDVLYQTGGGEYLRFFSIFGILQSPFPVTGLSSVRSVLPYFNNGQTIFLIHNTFMPEEDISWANEYAVSNGLKLVFCLCINANLYIENKVPPVDLFMQQHCQLVLGTDSYSSNWQLSIAKEMQSLRKHFPYIPDETILQWATSSGARALQWDNDLGSFEKGKRPGIVLISDDFEKATRVL